MRRILTALIPATALLVLALANATPAAASSGLQITATPGLYPGFTSTISDYVVRCQPGTPVSVSVTVPLGDEVFVDNQPGQISSFTTSVAVSAGQSFAVTDIGLTGGGASSYFVRCLPTDFPNFTSQKPGNPQAAYYVVKPSSLALFTPNPPLQYIAVFNTDGVPVWWLPDGPGFDAGILRNTNLTSIVFKKHPEVEVHRLDGTLAAGFDTANLGSSTPFSAADGHDVQLLPNGDYLTAEIHTTTGDLSWMCVSGVCGSSSALISDQTLEEISPSGALVWSWDIGQHIPLTETDPEWFAGILNPQGLALAPGADDYHWNSVQEVGDNILFSLRNADAIYEISKKTGKIIWKLGGTPRPESLRVVNDPVFDSGSGFGGQHFARFYGGTTTQVTLHDNGTGRGRGPRGVRYAISVSKRTATLLESVSDPLVTSSACCGSATKLPGGDWVASWGFSSVVTELNPAGARQFLLQWTDPFEFSYRAEPVLPGVLSIGALRSAMNTQYPRH